MKKHTAKQLRELAKHIPPVIMFEPKLVRKTGAQLNAIIDAEAEKAYNALPWYDKIKVAIKEHGADLGIIEKQWPKHFVPNKVYEQTQKEAKLVNHYKNLKREWEHFGQEGISRYAMTMANINKIQNGADVSQ